MGTAAGMVLLRALGFIWQGGWLPTDLWEITRRRTDATTTSLLVDTIAADTAQHAEQMIYERWAAQVRQLEADVWWERDHPHLQQWAPFQEMYSRTVRKSASVSNGEGWQAGRAAADRADLSVERRAVSA